MALIGTLRNKMGKIVVGAIMLTMVAFIGTDLIGNSTLLGGGQDQDIAEMAGNTISNTAFQNRVDEVSRLFSYAYQRNPLQEEIDLIRNQSWNALYIDNTYAAEFDELGIELTDVEKGELVKGKYIHPFVIQYFTNPQDNRDASTQINERLVYLREQGQDLEKLFWLETEQMVYRDRLFQKYGSLFEKTNYVTKYEAKQEHIAQNSNASIEYVFVPFLSIPDSAVSVTDQELENYIDDNASEFQRDETRNLEYVVFDIQPSSADSAVVEEEVAELREELMNTSNDSSFVAINSDDPYSFLTYYNDDLPDSLKGREVGYVSTPAISNGVYEFYKLSRQEEISSDSTLYRVARIKKDISLYISDRTVDDIYRKADYFSASCGNLEEFRKLAAEQDLRILKGNRIDKNAKRIGNLGESRNLVLWLYNEGEVGAVSDVKEVNDKYIVAAMTSEQEEGVANLADVRNQVERKVKNEKKAAIALEKFNSLDASTLEEMAAAYGDGAKSGSADLQMSSNNITGVGIAPDAVGLSFSLDEEEVTRAFAVQDGVMIVKLLAKDIAADVEDYSSYSLQLSGQRLGGNTIVADFPLSYFRLVVSRNVDQSIKEFAEIEDMRYKFF